MVAALTDVKALFSRKVKLVGVGARVKSYGCQIPNLECCCGLNRKGLSNTKLKLWGNGLQNNDL